MSPRLGHPPGRVPKCRGSDAPTARGRDTPADAGAEASKTYGLATLRKRHARVAGDTVTFCFLAKGGKRRLQSIVDADVVDVLAALKRRRGGGSDLLAYRKSTPGGRVTWVDVRSYGHPSTQGVG